MSDANSNNEPETSLTMRAPADQVELNGDGLSDVDLVDDQSVNYVWHESVVRSNISMHAIFLAISTGVILMSFLMRSEGPKSVYLPGSKIPLPESCASRRITGYDCPGCGLTRSFISISHGQFQRAWEFNATSFVLYPFCAIQIPWSLLQLYLLYSRRRGIEIPYLYFLPIAIVVILVVHWLWRLSYQVG